MSTLSLTLLLSFVIILLALLALGIGWLLTGKTLLKRGSCGKAPSSKKDCDKDEESCYLCSGKEESDNDKL